MKANLIKIKGTWREVANSARTTINKDAGKGEPSSSWKTRMLLAEHSPIRQVYIKVKWTDIPYWVTTHFVRHWLGIVHWVRTQRSDRTGLDRNIIPQGALVEHEFEANAQAMINISRKRLCKQASPETTEAWSKVLDEVKVREPELVNCCVPECVYRGFCPEYLTCGYYLKEEYTEALKKYRSGTKHKSN